ncbi:cytochrome b/b6 domain-containing protein [Dokdonella soli]|uniref:Cytochrome b/b6 domain-containing protein n=1 Tax=Dokdonella soli TaxID=529810 RepID=A0ABN1IYJ3_9GAMM
MNSPASDYIRVWDLPTRLFHWALVALIALQYASGEFGWLPMAWHYWLGYATLALILFRVLWGFAGSETSRFGDFVRGPRAVFRYIADSLHGRVVHMPGHNPLGSWSALLMLGSVALQAVSGLFTSDDISEAGPWVERMSEATVSLMTRIHHLNRYVLLLLIVLHVGAVLLHWVIRNDNLVAPMLHGQARFDRVRTLRFVSSWRALFLLALSAGAVWALVAWGSAS